MGDITWKCSGINEGEEEEEVFASNESSEEVQYAILNI